MSVLPVSNHTPTGRARFATVRYCPLGTQKSGNGDRQEAGDSGSCPMKTGPAPDFVCWLTAPDKREVGSSTLPRPMYLKESPQRVGRLQGFSLGTITGLQ